MLPSHQRHSKSFGVEINYHLIVNLYNQKGILKKEEKLEVHIAGYNIPQFQILKNLSNQEMASVKKIKKFNFNKEEVEMNLILPKKIFARGEKIEKISISLKNESQKSIKKVILQLDFKYQLNSEEIFWKHEELLKLPLQLPPGQSKQLNCEVLIPNNKKLPLSLISKFSKIEVSFSASFLFSSLFTSSAKISLPIFLFPAQFKENNYPIQNSIPNPSSFELFQDSPLDQQLFPSNQSQDPSFDHLEENIQFFDKNSKIPKSLVWQNNSNCVICITKFSVLKKKTNCR